MDKPPVSVFEQLLKKAGITVVKIPINTVPSSEKVVPFWENLIESLITEK